MLPLLSLSACVPLPRVTTPSGEVRVFGQDGQPISGASVTLAIGEGHVAGGSRKFSEFITDADGIARIPRERQWEVVWLAPDGGAIYDWSLCVEKSGFEAFPVAQPRFDGPILVELMVSPSQSNCVWPEQWNSDPERSTGI